MDRKAVAIILAGGVGKRMKAAEPKQFIELAGRPMIIYTLERFDANDLVSDIVIVCLEEKIKALDRIVHGNNIKKLYKIVPGSSTRQGSSFNGVKSCPPGTEYVLIHDAVRPFVSGKIIEDVLTAAVEAEAAGPVIDTGDTIIVAEGEYIRDIPERGILKRIQTPQCFRYETILKAHENAIKKGIKNATDDCALVLAMGKPVKTVEGSGYNTKITDSSDIVVAENFIYQKDHFDQHNEKGERYVQK